MANYGGRLAASLYPRYRDEWDNVALLDSLMRQDAVVALIQFLFIGLERGDLSQREVEEALGLARAGRLLKSSEHLAVMLADYRLGQLKAM